MAAVSSHQSQIEETLEESPIGWFAGGPNPTMADYMMLFGLETAVGRCPDLVGPKTKSWIDLVHGRWVPALLILRVVGHPYSWPFSLFNRPAYKTVSACIDGKPQTAKL